MTQEQKIIRAKLGLLALAKQLGPIRGVGASARPRCRPFSTPYHWQRKNSWRHDHGRQSYGFNSQHRLSDQVSANTNQPSGDPLQPKFKERPSWISSSPSENVNSVNGVDANQMGSKAS